MIIASDPHDGAIAIAELERLMFVKRHGGGDPYFGICDERSQCSSSVEIRRAAIEIITVG